MNVRCENCKKFFDSKEIIYDPLLDMEFCPKCREGSSMTDCKHITWDMWTSDFDEIAKAGDTVDEKIVEHFRNSLPPLVQRSGYLQASGAYSDVFVEDKGWYVSTYTTFKVINGVWTFIGNCLRNREEDFTNIRKISSL